MLVLKLFPPARRQPSDCLATFRIFIITISQSLLNATLNTFFCLPKVCDISIIVGVEVVSLVVPYQIYSCFGMFLFCTILIFILIFKLF